MAHPSRRGAIAAGLVLPLVTRGSASSGVSSLPASSDEVEQLVRMTEVSSDALMRGEIDHYLTLIRHAEDFTLMQPFGGAVTRGFDPRPEHLASLSRFFNGGESKLELVQSYASADIVVLAMVERQHGAVGGLPDQDWSLRVTQVYRREGSRWLLAHRHADPLVKGISLQRAAELAR
jgi:ketosteroid isomerase-like protein